MANEEPRQQLLRIIGELSAEKTKGERRISDLKKRLVELQAGYETASTELEQSKRAREAAERELRRSQTQLNRTRASLLKLETRTSELQNEIFQVSSGLHAIKNDGDIQRDEFISAMLKFNSEIRKFNEMTFHALQNGQPDMSTENDQGMDVQSEKDQKDLENEILSLDAEMHRLEEEYQKMFHDVNYNEVQEELAYFKKKVSLSEAIILKTKQLKDLSGQISELEKTCSSLGEELQRRYICPKCQFNNMEVSEGTIEAEGTPTSSTEKKSGKIGREMAYISPGEPQRRITDFFSRFSEAVSSQDGASLTPLLSVSSNSSLLLSLADDLNVFQDWARLVKHAERNSQQLGEFLVPYFRCIQSYRSGRFVEAYVAFEKFANAFLQEFRNWETAWAVEAMYVVAHEIRVLAEWADKELASAGKNPEKLQGAGSFLMKVFGSLAGKGPKRVGALYVTCQLFKVYFKLGTVNLCRSVIRSIETAKIFDFEEFPSSDKVTYMYYTGRLEVYNENFVTADQKLTYALMHCDSRYEANSRMILKYLIPVKLSIGILPKKSLLDKFNLTEYTNVVKALRQGDLRLLRRALQEHEDQFLRTGVYLVLEKLELQVYQRLVKKIYVIQKQKDPSKAHQIKLDLIVKALKWLEIDMDVDEVECIMAVLIYKNLMKGYFAHKSKVVVLSKQEPFPKLMGKPVSS